MQKYLNLCNLSIKKKSDKLTEALIGEVGDPVSGGTEEAVLEEDHWARFDARAVTTPFEGCAVTTMWNTLNTQQEAVASRHGVRLHRVTMVTDDLCLEKKVLIVIDKCKDGNTV